MGKRLDLTNQRFGRLVAIKDVSIIHKSRTWQCKCDCGNFIIVTTANLRNKNTKSCGCLSIDLLMERNYKHGYTFQDYSKNHPLYAVLKTMKSRCYNSNNPRYSDYGGRGIKICNEWLTSIKVFVKWSIDNGWEKGLQIDRIDNDGNYSCDNCRFVPSFINNQDKRIYKTNKTGYTGIVQNHDSKKFISTLSYNKKRYYFGSFDTAISACLARDNFIINNNFNTKIQLEQISGE